ncbi:hypothetical protein F511_47394 [Dorcoceras hygrometricum]|uniref:Uncharacterized protein n=1 Tax=Dorcoceras hygrometricum TaxID=472368 RepID=A0A2Z6ZR59_9LAMI|nr:hypothetical protein F511_47394 [Dorcoceras hygrometricum]
MRATSSSRIRPKDFTLFTVNISKTAIFLTSLQYTPYGAAEILDELYVNLLTTYKKGLPEKARSCDLVISRAMSADDMINAGTDPNCKSMRSPYVLDNSCRDRCGSFPS